MVLGCIKTNLEPAPLLVETACAAITPRETNVQQCRCFVGMTEARAVSAAVGKFPVKDTERYTHAPSPWPGLIFQNQDRHRDATGGASNACARNSAVQHPRQRGGVGMACGDETKLAHGRQAGRQAGIIPQGDIRTPTGQTWSPSLGCLASRQHSIPCKRGCMCMSYDSRPWSAVTESLAGQSDAGAGHDWGLFLLCCLII